MISIRLPAVLSPFRQLHYVSPPKIPGNAFITDSILPRLISAVYQQRGVSPTIPNNDLYQFGLQYRKLNKLATDCEMYPPKLQRLDGWGGRIDRVITCDSWKELHNIASTECLVAIGHDLSSDHELREVWQSIKLILFSSVSGMVSCPLAMTDGAASTLSKLLKLHQNCAPGECSVCSAEWISTVSQTISNLTSTNPENFWTSGQWMTERAGGSDVTRSTQTVALRDEQGVLRLYGNKFYTSAIDCQVALVLARYDENLSLFLVHLPQEYDGTIQIEKLKDKLGTRQLPTADLTLNGVPALLLAERGIANIVPMLQVTRLYNALSATSYLRHVTTLAHSYAESRSAFGHTINKLPLHKTSLAKLETFSRALILQSVDLALILNAKEETPSLSSSVGRVLSAVVKIHTAQVAVTTLREGLESFGGAGYMEDTGLPGLFRDACVLPVWEGTSDVLSAETIRALSRGSSQTDVLRYIRELAMGWCVLGGHQYSGDLEPCQPLEVPLTELGQYLTQLEVALEDCQYTGRTVALGIGAAHAAASLISFARYTQQSSDVAAARLWCKMGLVSLNNLDSADIEDVLSSTN